MANICTNELYAHTNNANNYEKIVAFLTEYEGDIYEQEQSESPDTESYLMAQFDSKWRFPESDFEMLMSKLEPDKSLYIRVLSHEFTCEYVSFRKYEDGEWRTICES